jgi:hypothetical protein
MIFVLQEVIAYDPSEATQVELTESQIDLDKDHIEEVKQSNKDVSSKLNDFMSKNNINEFARERRRLTIFKNIYHQCRIQKRKDRELCLYLANLYQNLKGFHGL